MSRIVIAALTFIFFQTGVAQTKTSAFTGELKFGAAVPVGKFSNKALNIDGQSPSSGWAKLGPAVQVVINYALSKDYGLSLLFSGQQNKQDEKSVTNYLKSRFNYPADASFSTNARQWKICEILVGGFIKIPFSGSDKLFFNVNARAGVLKTSLPGYSYTVYSTQNGMPVISGYGSQESQKLSWSFCYQLTTGLGVQCSSRLYASADIAYSHAAPAFHYTSVTGFPDNPVYTEHKTRFPVASVNLMAGIGYKF